MRIIGPNCIGVMLPHIGLNATFAKPLALPGNIGFVSQSGALCTAILDWSMSSQLGFSAFISIGSMADVNWGDLIYYLGDDPHTRSILLYMESVGDACLFLSAGAGSCRSQTDHRDQSRSHASRSESRSVAYRRAHWQRRRARRSFPRVGVLRVDTIEELFGLANFSVNNRARRDRVCDRDKRRRSGRFSRHPCADRMRRKTGGVVQTKLFDKLNKLLPAALEPMETRSIFSVTRVRRRTRRRSKSSTRDENNDGLLVILAPAGGDRTDALRPKDCARLPKLKSQTDPRELDRRSRRPSGCGDPGPRGHSDV